MRVHLKKAKGRVKNYAECLMCLGDGKLQTVSDAAYSDVIPFPSDLCVDSELDIINHVYRGLEEPENRTNANCLAARGILTTTTHAQVDDINKVIMQRLPGHATIVKSADTVSNQSQNMLYPPEFLNTINISGLPAHRMTLTSDAPIMLRRQHFPIRPAFCVTINKS